MLKDWSGLGRALTLVLHRLKETRPFGISWLGFDMVQRERRGKPAKRIKRHPCTLLLSFIPSLCLTP